MQGFGYGQLVSMVTYYLEQYPHVGVALECVREDVEGDGKMANQVLKAISRIEEGESDVEVLKTWGEEVGSRDLLELSSKIERAVLKGQDIGLYLKKHSPGASQKRDQSKRKNYRNSNSNYKGKNKRSYNSRNKEN